MKESCYKRAMAYVLSSVLLLASVGADNAARATLNPDPNDRVDIKLSYPEHDEGRPSVTTILTGGNTKVTVQTTGNFDENPPGLKILAMSGIQDGADISGLISTTGTGQTKTITVSPELAGKMTSGAAQFSIRGDYIALLNKGTAFETADGYGTNIETKSFTSDTTLGIMEDSSITLICTQEETATQMPQFAILKDGAGGITGNIVEGEGWFKGFDGNSSISVSQDTTKISSPNQSEVTNFDKQLVFTMRGKTAADGTTDNAQYKFRVRIGQVHARESATETNPDGTPKIESYDNYISLHTKIKLSFTGPTSTTLLLSVLKPEEACNRIAAEIETDDGVSDLAKKYIRLEGDDALNYITQDFWLNNTIKQYGEEFQIKWTWTPDEAAGAGVVQPDSSEERGFQPALIDRKYDNVNGALKALVQYRPKAEASVSKKKETNPIRIVIRGTGQPASVLQIDKTIGASGQKVVFTGDEQKVIPKQIDMDVYDGGVVNFPKPNEKPYKYRLQLNMGKNNAASEYAKVNLTGGDEEAVLLGVSESGNVATEVAYGEEIANPKIRTPSVEGTVFLELTANKEGYVAFEIVYYLKNNKGEIVPAMQEPVKIQINVADTSPDDDATLKMLYVNDQNKQALEGFEFKPEQSTYDIEVDYSVTQITVAPYKNTTKGGSMVNVYGTYRKDDGSLQEVINQQLRSGYTSDRIDMIENATVKIVITVRAENPNITLDYVLNITRNPPSNNSNLKELHLFDKEGTDALEGQFKSDVKDYELLVPYHTDMLRVQAITEHPGATKDDPPSPSFSPPLQANSLFGRKEWLKLTYKQDNPFESTTTLRVTVTPENGMEYDKSVYTVKVTRDDPSHNATLSNLQLTDGADAAITTMQPAFHAVMEEGEFYTVEIPFTTEKVKFIATTGDTADVKYSTLSLMEGDKEKQSLQSGSPSKAISIPVTKAGEQPTILSVRVTAEDGYTVQEYPVHIYRAEPDKDATLSGLVMADEAGTAVEDFVFNPEVDTYDVTVPYATDKVTLTPTPAFAGVTKITVDGKRVEPGAVSQLIKIPYPDTKEILVVVTAEDKETEKTYTIRVKREGPDTDARLIGLEVTSGGENFKPTFIASTLDYTCDVVADAEGVTITATTNSPNATLTINGKAAVSGQASELIKLIEIEQKVDIVVTAQDGKTQMTYSITFTNQNLIDKSSNADLRSLKVVAGEMSPKFAPAVTTYDVAVKEDVASVELFPVPADKYATVKVFAGTKEIGDNKGNYAAYIQDGENAFKITVTPHDAKAAPKDYLVNVYRNEEDKMGTLKPITADMVDFENAGDVIVVDITKYTRVAAEVFNTLMQEYPEKKIIFQGNDYSLEFNGADLKTIVPFGEIFDFKMRFESPDEDEIMQEIESHPGNDSARVVLVHFDQEGALPAPATFQLSLGEKYANERLFWHYYNKERERIDYYGYFNTNSKGTFAVKLEHFSTYIVADQVLEGSENKAGAGGATLGTSGVADGKINPNTGKKRGQA